jgi:L-alanine-DL-glutamate epimerase-like enolase superfamily enzyme
MFQPSKNSIVKNLEASIDECVQRARPRLSVFSKTYPLNLQAAKEIKELLEEKTAFFWILEASEDTLGIGESSFVTVQGRPTESPEKIVPQISALPQQISSLDVLSGISSPRLPFGLSCGLVDCVAKLEGLSPLKYLAEKLNLDSYPTQVAVRGVLFQNEEEKLKDLKRYYKHFKLKLGPLEEEISLVQNIILSNKDCIFSVDCNGSFENCPEKLLQFEKAILDGKGSLEYIEQPFNSRKKILDLRDQFKSPFALDQSLRTRDDFDYWRNYRDFIWVLKVSAIGSLFEVIQIAELAKTSGNKFLIGGMLETVVGKVWQLYLCCLLSPDLPSEISVPNRYFPDEDLIIDSKFLYPSEGVIILPTESPQFNIKEIKSFEQRFPLAR